MEEVDITDWYKAAVRENVLNGLNFATRYGNLTCRDGRDFTDDFLKWKINCEGRVAVRLSSIEKSFESYIYFEFKNDLTLYVLTFEEIDDTVASYTIGYKGATQIDTASYYCPYVPLQISNK